jgi:exodeoxyribonuclease V gamma subunit
VTFRLVVAEHLKPLAAEAAAVLRVAPIDPFARDLVAVPGDAARTWLVGQLARSLGATSAEASDGIVANVELVYPGALVRRALGVADETDPWSIGPLTWVVHDLLHVHQHELGLAPELARARAIADLFDRYGLHRVEMVHAWERGHDLGVDGQPLPAAATWQPHLWRLLARRIGQPSPAARMASLVEQLRAGVVPTELPERLVVFGVAGLPAVHLDVLGAVAAHREVHVLAPVPSLAWWRRLHPAARDASALAVLRAHDVTTETIAHPLARTWARSHREGHLGLLTAAVRAGATIVESGSAPPTGPSTLLARVQQAIRSDLDPSAPATGSAQPLDPSDRSVQWHRCHGLGRQVEVLRDVVLRMLDERDQDGRPRLHPRDIVVLCPDVAAAAPLVEAVFAGDGPGGALPAIPVRVADRSLRRDVPLFEAVLAVLDLLDSRFRAGDLLAVAMLPPVSRRFGFTPDAVGRLSTWIDATHIRWGRDAEQRSGFGIPPTYTANTWRAGLDQLLLGAAVADRGIRRGAGGVVPYGDLEGDDVVLLGALAEFVDLAGAAVERLGATRDPAEWCEVLLEAARELCSLDDADSWQWELLEDELGAVRDEALASGVAHLHPIEPHELAALLSGQLSGRPGRPRFGTGAVTVSSLTAQRGIPYPVVCLLGLDGELGAAGASSADDLIAQMPCVGDRDARSEVRAQLLDAVLAAGEQLVLCSTGRHLATNAEVPPAVVLAELVDLIDATAPGPVEGARGAAGRTRAAMVVDHPRQAWSEPNFVPGVLGLDGPWSFDAVACAAARQRRRQHAPSAPVDVPLAPVALAEVTLGELHRTLQAPQRTLLSDRLGLGVDAAAEARGDTVPLTLVGLDKWRVADQLLAARLAVPAADADAAAAERAAALRAMGAVPPFRYGDRSIRVAVEQAADVHRRLDLAVLAAGVPADAESVEIDLTCPDHTIVRGRVDKVHGHLLIDASVSKISAKRRLDAWLDLAALAAMQPDQPWEALLIGSESTSGDPGYRTVVEQLVLVDAHQATEVLALLVDLHRRALGDAIPFFPKTSLALVVESRSKASKAWSGGSGFSPGEGDDVWIRRAFGELRFDELVALEPRDDERGLGWPPGGRFERWAHRIGGAFARTARSGAPTGEEPDDDG